MSFIEASAIDPTGLSLKKGQLFTPPGFLLIDTMTPWALDALVFDRSPAQKKQRAFAIPCREVKWNIAKIHSGA